MAKKSLVTKDTATEMVNWEEEFKTSAETARKQEANVGGAASLSIKGGVLSYGGNPIPGNAICVVIADAIMENKYFTTEYDPDSPTSPDCYAFGRSDDEMGPHDNAEDPQCETCADCPHNQWGSADKGRGKACANRRKLLVVEAGEIDRAGEVTTFDQAEDLGGPLMGLSLPPTSLKAFAAYTNKVIADTGRPLWAVTTVIRLKPDPTKQVAIEFEYVDKVPQDLLAKVRARHLEAEQAIVVPYPKNSEREEAKPAPKGKTAAKRGKY